jgi:hypothetical protein
MKIDTVFMKNGIKSMGKEVPHIGNFCEKKDAVFQCEDSEI